MTYEHIINQNTFSMVLKTVNFIEFNDNAFAASFQVFAHDCLQLCREIETEVA